MKDLILANTVTPMLHKKPIKQPKPIVNNILPPYPDELFNLTGGLGEVATFIYNTMSYPSMALASVSSIAALSAFAQTNITINSLSGLGFNEYFMILAPTGFGKEAIRKAIIKLDKESSKPLNFNPEDGNLSNINFEEVAFCHAAPSSKQGLHQMLEQHRSAFYMCDEFAEYLKMTKNAGYKQETLGYLMTIYTSALGIIHPGAAVTQQYENVTNPRLGVFATSTAEALFDTLSKEQAESGAYNRWFIFASEQELPDKRYEGLEFNPPQAAIEFIQWLKAVKPTQVKFSQAGFKTFKELDSKLAEPIKKKDYTLGGRLAEQSIKLAGLIALSEKRFNIEPNDLHKAFNIRIGLYKRAKVLADLSGSLSGQHKTTEALSQLTKHFKTKQFIYLSQLPALSRRYENLTIYEQNAVINTLIDRGIALKDENKPKVLISAICKN